MKIILQDSITNGMNTVDPPDMIGKGECFLLENMYPGMPPVPIGGSVSKEVISEGRVVIPRAVEVPFGHTGMEEGVVVVSKGTNVQYSNLKIHVLPVESIDNSQEVLDTGVVYDSLTPNTSHLVDAMPIDNFAIVVCNKGFGDPTPAPKLVEGNQAVDAYISQGASAETASPTYFPNGQSQPQAALTPQLMFEGFMSSPKSYFGNITVRMSKTFPPLITTHEDNKRMYHFQFVRHTNPALYPNITVNGHTGYDETELFIPPLDAFGAQNTLPLPSVIESFNAGQVMGDYDNDSAFSVSLGGENYDGFTVPASSRSVVVVPYMGAQGMPNFGDNFATDLRTNQSSSDGLPQIWAYTEGYPNGLARINDRPENGEFIWLHNQPAPATPVMGNYYLVSVGSLIDINDPTRAAKLYVVKMVGTTPTLFEADSLGAEINFCGAVNNEFGISNADTTPSDVTIHTANYDKFIIQNAMRQGATHVRVSRTKAYDASENTEGLPMWDFLKAQTALWLVDLPIYYFTKDAIIGDPLSMSDSIAQSITTWNDTISDAALEGEANQLLTGYSFVPNALALEYSKGRLLYLTENGIVWYSEIVGGDGKYSLLSTANSKALYAGLVKPANYIDCESFDGQRATGMRKLNDDLYIFKESKIFIIIGGDPSQAPPTRISSAIGCIFPNTITVCDINGITGNSILFMSSEGPCIIRSGADIRLLTEFKIAEMWPKISNEIYGERTDEIWSDISVTAGFAQGAWWVTFQKQLEGGGFGANATFAYHFGDGSINAGSFKFSFAEEDEPALTFTIDASTIDEEGSIGADDIGSDVCVFSVVPTEGEAVATAFWIFGDVDWVNGVNTTELEPENLPEISGDPVTVTVSGLTVTGKSYSATGTFLTTDNGGGGGNENYDVSLVLAGNFDSEYGLLVLAELQAWQTSFALGEPKTHVEITEFIKSTGLLYITLDPVTSMVWQSLSTPHENPFAPPNDKKINFVSVTSYAIEVA
jgi:hypothetical protein